MAPRARASTSRAPLVGLALIVLASCRARAADTREWQPSDHDHTEEPAPGQARKPGGRSEAAQAMQRHGISDVALLTWRKRCVSCHGIIGRADGPEAAVTGARDLSDPAWQASASDERIQASIKNGRGTMPAFDLPESTLDALVRLVRLLNREARPPTPAADASGSRLAPPQGEPKALEPAAASATAPNPGRTTPPKLAPTPLP